MNAPSAPTPRDGEGTSPAPGPHPDYDPPTHQALPHADGQTGETDGTPRTPCAGPPPLSPEVRLGHDAQDITPARTRLPTTRQALPLRKVLEALGPDMAAASCEDLNHLHDIIKTAQTKDNLVIDFMATRTAIQEQRKFIELALGRTVNINQNIKSQRDLPRLDKLSAEKRAQLETLLSELSSDEVLDVEFTNVPPHQTP